MTCRWPLYFKELLHVGNLKSNVGIAALWTRADKIYSGLENNSYAVVGQLYSQAGVNFIVRNVLANPKIRYLILCGQESKIEKSGQALVNLKKGGVDRNNLILGTKSGYLDKEIPLRAINDFRQGVEIIDLRGVYQSNKIQRAIKALPAKKPFSQPQVFPQPQFQKSQFPNDRTPEKIKGENIASVWLQMLKFIMRFGNDEMTNYATIAREVPNLIAVVTDENPFSPHLEPCLNLTKKEIKAYVKEEFMSKKVTGEKYYTYGERLRAMRPGEIDQIKIIVKKLKKDFNDRGAMAVLWDVKKDNQALRNPCLVSVQGKIIKGALDLTAHFRSNDIFGAWPLNAYGLRAIQFEIAKKLKAKVGILTTISSCAHIYQERFRQAEEIIKKDGQRMSCEWDRRGNFVVKVEKGKIIASHFSPDGSRLLAEHEGKTARQVFDQIIKALGVSQISHAFDLGAELQKAEIASRLGIPYNQDQALRLKK